MLPTTWPVITVAFRCRHDGQRNRFKNGEFTIAVPIRPRAHRSGRNHGHTCYRHWLYVYWAGQLVEILAGTTGAHPVAAADAHRRRLTRPVPGLSQHRSCDSRNLVGARISPLHSYATFDPPWSCWAANRDRAVSKPFGDNFIGRLPDTRRGAHARQSSRKAPSRTIRIEDSCMPR